MIFKRVVIALLLIFSLIPLQKTHAETANVGFVPSNIWYSKDPFEEGDKIKIYTLIFNPDSRELSGTVNFFDKSTLLGKKAFVVSAGGVKDVSVNWTVTAGDHSIFGKIEDAKFLVSAGKYEDVTLTEDHTTESNRTVSKKIIVNKDNTSGSSGLNTDSAIVSSIQNIPSLIKENTPDSVAKPIVLGASTVESFRQDVATSTISKKDSVNADIETLNKKETAQATKDKASKTETNINGDTFLKPLKYVELFLLTLVAFIFNNKIVFYGLLIVILFFILRFIKRLIFK